MSKPDEQCAECYRHGYISGLREVQDIVVEALGDVQMADWFWDQLDNETNRRTPKEAEVDA